MHPNPQIATDNAGAIADSERNDSASSELSASIWSSMQNSFRALSIQNRNTQSDKTCLPETEVKPADGVEPPTMVHKLTAYGEWLREQAGIALNIEPPEDIAPLSQEQQDLLDAAGPRAQELARKLLEMSQGGIDPTMRQDLKELQKLFNQRNVSPDEAREFYKAVCDAINVQLAANGKDWMRIAVSETTGEVYVGVKSQLDGKFKPTFELRSQTDCPQMPQ